MPPRRPTPRPPAPTPARPPLTCARALYKPNAAGWGTVVFARLSDATCEFTTRELLGRSSAKTRRRAFATSEAAASHFEATCAEKLGAGFTEVRLESTGNYSVLSPSMFTEEEQADLATTERRRRGEAEPLTAGAAAAAAGGDNEDRAELLLGIVTGRDPRVKRAKFAEVVDISSGYLVTADPMLVGDAKRFARALPTGRYSVILSRVGERNAAATLVLGGGIPTRWELASPRKTRTPDPRVTRAPADSYPVDSGCGSFMDDAVATALDEDDDAREKIVRIVASEPTRVALRRIGSAGSVAAFASGHGDGRYGTYFGFRDDALVCVTTDFLVL